MRRIKVVHIRPIWLSQTETWLYHQIRHLTSFIEPHVICKNIMNLDQFPLNTIVKLNDPSFFEIKLEKLLTKFSDKNYSVPLIKKLIRMRPSVLHSHFGHHGWAEITAAKLAHIKQIVTFYGYDINRLPRIAPVWKQRYHQLFNNVKMVLCEGHVMAKSIVNLGCPEHKIHVHHLGIPLDNIPFIPRKWKTTDRLRVLIAASFREKKGIPYALQALGEIQASLPIEITIIGDANNTPRSQQEKTKIIETIKHYKLSSKVRMLGYQPYSALLTEAYNHHVFLSPSITASDGDSEGGVPVTLIEMAASGMPVISTKHCDIPEVIQENELPLLAEERDVQGLVNILESLLDKNNNWRPFLEKSRAHIEKEYNAKIQGSKLSILYKDLVQ